MALLWTDFGTVAFAVIQKDRRGEAQVAEERLFAAWNFLIPTEKIAATDILTLALFAVNVS